MLGCDVMAAETKSRPHAFVHVMLRERKACGSPPSVSTVQQHPVVSALVLGGPVKMNHKVKKEKHYWFNYSV